VLDPSRTMVTVPNGQPDVPTEIQVELRDTKDHVFTGPAPGLSMEVRGANAGAATQGTDQGDGTHILSYVPTELGEDTLDVALDGEAFPDSPFESRVRIAYQAASGAATVDGTLAPGEWDAATAYPVFAGPLEGSTVAFMADATNLYVAVRVPDPALSGFAEIRFDDTVDLVLDGDDVLVYSSDGFQDGHFGPNISLDTEANGAGAAAVAGNWLTVEIAHPLDSGDQQDFDLADATGVGVCVRYLSSLTTLGRETTTPEECELTAYQQTRYAELLLPR